MDYKKKISCFLKNFPYILYKKDYGIQQGFVYRH